MKTQIKQESLLYTFTGTGEVFADSGPRFIADRPHFIEWHSMKAIMTGGCTMIGTMMLTLLSGLWALTLHVSSGGGFPRPLSPREEQECLSQIKNGDLAARNRLVEHNLRLVAHIVKKYYAAPGEQEDLISIGSVGLIKAAGTFDPDKNTRFATYASRCIENAILTRRPFLMILSREKCFSDRNGDSFAVFAPGCTDWSPI